VRRAGRREGFDGSERESIDVDYSLDGVAGDVRQSALADAAGSGL
jgi:hypothetical protein